MTDPYSHHREDFEQNGEIELLIDFLLTLSDEQRGEFFKIRMKKANLLSNLFNSLLKRLQNVPLELNLRESLMDVVASLNQVDRPLLALCLRQLLRIAPLCDGVASDSQYIFCGQLVRLVATTTPPTSLTSLFRHLQSTLGTSFVSGIAKSCFQSNLSPVLRGRLMVMCPDLVDPGAAVDLLQCAANDEEAVSTRRKIIEALVVLLKRAADEDQISDEAGKLLLFFTKCLLALWSS